MRLLAVLLLSTLLCISALGQSYNIYNFAGGGAPTSFPPRSIILTNFGGGAVDSAGNGYFSAMNMIFRMDASSGQVTRIAGNGGPFGYSGDNGPATSASFNSPEGIAVDSAGNVYVADSGNNVVRKISNGTITTFAGNGQWGYSGDGGPATSASLGDPGAVTLDSAGNLYIADTRNFVIRKVSSGIISTVAGNGKAGNSGDGGPALNAEFAFPEGVAVDSAGKNLYIADADNGVIRKVSNGIITAFAGDGQMGYSGDNGPATSASLNEPASVAVDSAGNVYIADTNNAVVRKVSNGIITTFAGNGTYGYSGDGGLATSAELASPSGVAVGNNAGVFILDYANPVIRKVTGNGVINTVVGGGSGFWGDNGPATGSMFEQPLGVAVDANSNVYVADGNDNAIRKVSNGTITTIAGNGFSNYAGDGGPASSALGDDPNGVVVDAAGTVYFTVQGDEVVRKLSKGVISTVAGNGYYGYSGDGGPATSATLAVPQGLAIDSAGNIYIADSSNNVIRKVSNGTITTVAGSGKWGYTGDGGPATSATLDNPVGVAADSAGNIYIADRSNNAIRKVSNGTITTIANATHLNQPSAIALDMAGNLYVGDNSGTISKISNGVVTPIAGTGKEGYSGDGGPALSATLGWVSGLAVDAAGDIYFADSSNNAIRMLVPPLAGQTASVAGPAGNGSLQVNVPAGAPWTATSNASWITITSGASGTGAGTVTFSVATNTSVASRAGTLTIAGQTFSIQQESGAPAASVLAGSMAHIAAGATWDTSLTLVNLSSSPGEAMVNFYANDGSAPWWPFALLQDPSWGTILGATFDETLAPDAMLVLDSAGTASTSQVGSAQLLTSGDIGGFAIFKYVPSGQEAVVPLETRNAGSYVLAFDNTGQIATGLAIANLAPVGASVGVTVRDDTGAQIGTGTINLAAQGHNSFMLTDPTLGFPIAAGKRGTAVFSTPSGGRISVLGLRANGAALTTLPVLANVGTAGGLMAHVASGGGWETIFTLVNTGATQANVTLKFFDNNGSPLPLPLSFPQTEVTATESSVSQTIAAGATLLIVTQGQSSGSSATGSAQLTTNGDVSGFAIFQSTAAGQEAVVPLESGTANSYFLAFDNTNGLATGIALANSSAQPAAIPATLWGENGISWLRRRSICRATNTYPKCSRRYSPARPIFAAPSSSVRHQAARSVRSASAPLRPELLRQFR